MFSMRLLVLVVVGSVGLAGSVTATPSFDYPECAVYHAGTGRYFISNEGNGTVIQITTGWDTTLYVSGLETGVGMVVLRDSLFVSASGNTIAVFDLTSDLRTGTITVSGATRLNDICADSSGHLWVSDPQGAQVFRVDLATQTSMPILNEFPLPMVNGVHYDYANDRILLNQWINDSPISAIALFSLEVVQVRATTLDNMNGFTVDGEGNFLVSVWGSSPYTNSAIYRFPPDFSGAPELVSDGHNGGGDMYYDIQTTLIVMPNVRGQSVDFFYDPFRDPEADGILSGSDNCPTVSNPGQEDADQDGIGDACDPCTDTDDDGFGDVGYPANTCPVDNCPEVANADQTDTDGDGTGDACEPCLCPYQSDIEPDGFLTAIDMAACIDILFAGSVDIKDESCPSPRFDFDCDGFSTAIDLSRMIDHLFAGGTGPCGPCAT